MTKTTRYGLIGCGMMGQEHLKNIALLPDTAVTGIYEPDAGMREIAAPLAPQARFAISLEALLADDTLDCLVITSPNHCHADQMAQIAATRPLPLLVEKPLLTQPEDIPRLTEIAASYPAPIWVAMEYRYMPPIAAMLRDTENATGGTKMLTIREHRFPFLNKVGNWNRFNRQTGGTLVEKCCHFFDLMRLIIGTNPVRVMASAGQDVNHLDESYDDGAPDILDNGYVIVDFEGGARAMLELCMFAEGARYQEVISAVGPAGKIEAFVPGPTRFWPADLGPAPTPVLEISPRTPKRPTTQEVPVDPALLAAGDHNGSTFYQHQRFLEVMRGERPVPDVSFDDGLWAVRMGMAAQRSAETGQAVAL
ncbi:Gfo/Idh/MocA family oxidoreductase [Roseobacter sp. YSTF-M11]|uniref:Gfo/Idh/MocA family oxidoreductase n=1 Tax=Roseobacter insulae TaxID=2859783 RepID=A0A9X1K5C8_9RHOB|nr:Gfo/Idh/MocA family oxidoreductase [Roseobacter insulae]MBW4710697.1 Gfo/Idh/MocA family oxidoreductase [Roseobacter insulae]